MTIVRAPLSGTKRKDGRWQITVTLTRIDGIKEKKTVYGETQREAQEKARALIATGRKSPANVTITDLLDFCEQGPWKRLAARTQEQYKYARPRIEKKFGKEKVAALTMPAIYAWVVDEMASDPALSGRTIQIHRSVLRVALQQAMFRGFRKDNPAAGWRMPVSVKADTVPIAPVDVLRAIDLEPDRRKRLFLRTLWETGARPDEATRLISNALEKVGETWWVWIPGTKTDNAPRVVPISADLANDLLELPEPWFDYSRRSWTHLWHTAQERLGWRPKRLAKKRQKPDRKLPTIYAIRGARVTEWKDQGVSDEVWIALAGHENVDLTRRIYDRVGIRRIAAQLGLSLSLSSGEEAGA